MTLLSGGKHATRVLKRAQILLAADAGTGEEKIACAIGVGGSTVYRTMRRFVPANRVAALGEEAVPWARMAVRLRESPSALHFCRGLVGAGRDHSHDHRPDCKQICVALVETFDGFPLGHEVFEAAHWQANNSSRVGC